MAMHYEKLLCPRCFIPIKHINEIHKTADLRTCAPKKIEKGAFIYLLHDIDQHLLKIGYSTNPPRRFKEIKNANTNQIKIIGIIPGSLTNEAILHTRWKKYNYKLEWFNYEEEILEYFENHPDFQKWI